MSELTEALRTHGQQHRGTEDRGGLLWRPSIHMPRHHRSPSLPVQRSSSPAASAAQASATSLLILMGLPVVRLVPVTQSWYVPGATPRRRAASRPLMPMWACHARRSAGVTRPRHSAAQRHRHRGHSRRCLLRRAPSRPAGPETPQRRLFRHPPKRARLRSLHSRFSAHRAD